MNHRIFERTLRPLVFRRACLFERHFTTQAWLGIGRRGVSARLKVFRLSCPSLSVVDFSIRFGVRMAAAVKSLFKG